MDSNLLSHRLLIQGFIMPNLVDKYKTIFLEKQWQPWNLSKRSPYLGVSYKFALKFVKSLSRTFWLIQNFWKGKKYLIWSTNIKPFFLECEKNLDFLFHRRFHFVINFFEFCQKHNSNPRIDWILVQYLKMPNLLDKYKATFLGKQGWLWNFQKSFFSY